MRRFSCFAAVYLLVVASTVAFADGEKYLLKERPAVGDVFRVSDSMTMSMTVKVTSKSVNQEQNVSKVDKSEYKEDIVATDEHGPTNMLRSYTIAISQESDPGLPEKNTRHGYEGKTVRLVRTPAGKHATISEGKLTPADETELLGDLANKGSDELPAYAVAVGDSWVPDTKKMFGEPTMVVSSAKATFAEITNFQGHKCARIVLNCTLGSDPAAMGLAGEITGEVLFALDINRVVSRKAEGPIKMENSVKANGETIEMHGAGKINAVMTLTYLRVAGKAV
jgi:hypothetical protein